MNAHHQVSKNDAGSARGDISPSGTIQMSPPDSLSKVTFTSATVNKNNNESKIDRGHRGNPNYHTPPGHQVNHHYKPSGYTSSDTDTPLINAGSYYDTPSMSQGSLYYMSPGYTYP